MIVRSGVRNEALTLLAEPAHDEIAQHRNSLDGVRVRMGKQMIAPPETDVREDAHEIGECASREIVQNADPGARPDRFYLSHDAGATELAACLLLQRGGVVRAEA